VLNAHHPTIQGDTDFLYGVDCFRKMLPHSIQGCHCLGIIISRFLRHLFLLFKQCPSICHCLFERFLNLCNWTSVKQALPLLALVLKITVSFLKISSGALQFRSFVSSNFTEIVNLNSEIIETALQFFSLFALLAPLRCLLLLVLIKSAGIFFPGWPPSIPDNAGLRLGQSVIELVDSFSLPIQSNCNLSSDLIQCSECGIASISRCGMLLLSFIPILLRLIPDFNSLALDIFLPGDDLNLLSNLLILRGEPGQAILIRHGG
jgi:hypothetical protein